MMAANLKETTVGKHSIVDDLQELDGKLMPEPARPTTSVTKMACQRRRTIAKYVLPGVKVLQLLPYFGLRTGILGNLLF